MTKDRSGCTPCQIWPGGHSCEVPRNQLGYLDDLTLAGPQSLVATDIQHVMADRSKIGLCLNPSKCEVISHPDLNIVDRTTSSFTFVSVANATLLGAPLFPSKVLDDTWMAVGTL